MLPPDDGGPPVPSPCSFQPGSRTIGSSSNELRQRAHGVVVGLANLGVSSEGYRPNRDRAPRRVDRSGARPGAQENRDKDALVRERTARLDARVNRGSRQILVWLWVGQRTRRRQERHDLESEAGVD